MTTNDIDAIRATDPHARTYVPALCAEVEQLRETVGDRNASLDRVIAERDAARDEVEQLRADLAQIADTVAPTVTAKPTSAAVRSLHHLYNDWVKTAHERLAKVDELTAERDELTAYNRAVKAANDDLRAELAQANAALTEARRYAADRVNEVGRLASEMAGLRQERDAHATVVEAAKRWAASEGIADNALLDALEAPPKAVPDPRHRAPNGCDDCSVEPGERHRYAECPGNLRAIERAKAEATR